MGSHVTEIIDYDFGPSDHHGISREISTTVPDSWSSWFFERTLRVSNMKILRDGKPEPATLSTPTIVHIGDANVSISGTHTYIISYDVAGAIVSFSTGEQGLYWNAVGNGWTVPIRRMTATIEADPGVLSTQNFCYNGSFGATTPCTIRAEAGGYIFEAVGGREQGLTVQQAVNPGTVAVQKVLHPKPRVVFFGGLFLSFLFLLLIGRNIKYKFRTHVPVIAQYEPYEMLSPMLGNYLIGDPNIFQSHMIAEMLYAAEQGYIQIEEQPGAESDSVIYSYTLCKLPPSDSAHLALVFTMLFGDTPTIGATGTFANVVIESYYFWSFRIAVEKDLSTLGFYERLPHLKFVWLVLLGIITSVSYTCYLSGIAYTVIPVIVLLFVLPFTLVVRAIVNRWLSVRITAKGYEALAHMQGFAQYLRVTDAERRAFVGAPIHHPDLFIQYLPYAIALGTEKQWADTFAHVNLVPPVWYKTQPDTTYTSEHFITLSTTMFSAGRTKSFVVPLQTGGSSYSRSSSSSGSFGGGSVGGGAGGGGGRSW